MSIELFCYICLIMPFNIVITWIFTEVCDIPKNVLIRILLLFGAVTPIPIIIVGGLILFNVIYKLFGWIGGNE